MKNTLEFLAETEIKIKAPDPTITGGWTSYDTNLMQDAINAGYSGKTLSSINCCRMHMKALYRSDILDTTGQEITTDAFTVTNLGRTSNIGEEYNWQPRERPSPTTEQCGDDSSRKHIALKGITENGRTPVDHGQQKPQHMSYGRTAGTTNYLN